MVARVLFVISRESRNSAIFSVIARKLSQVHLSVHTHSDGVRYVPATTTSEQVIYAHPAQQKNRLLCHILYLIVYIIVLCLVFISPAGPMTVSVVFVVFYQQYQQSTLQLTGLKHSVLYQIGIAH